MINCAVTLRQSCSYRLLALFCAMCQLSEEEVIQSSKKINSQVWNSFTTILCKIIYTCFWTVQWSLAVRCTTMLHYKTFDCSNFRILISRFIRRWTFDSAHSINRRWWWNWEEIWWLICYGALHWSNMNTSHAKMPWRKLINLLNVHRGFDARTATNRQRQHTTTTTNVKTLSLCITGKLRISSKKRWTKMCKSVKP